MSGIGQSVEPPTVAASAHEKRAQPSSPTGEYKLKSVAEFKVGDTIMALNHETGQREQKTVKQTFQRQVDHLRTLEVKSEDGSTRTIKTTDEHPFWVPSADEYVEAKQLTPGTKLTGANGHFITVTSTRHEPYPEGVTVYNVEVEGFHNYFVAANGYRGPPVLAHNTCGPGQFKKVNESMSVVAADYQRRVTGTPNGQTYLLNGRKFDGKTLIEAKSLEWRVAEEDVAEGLRHLLRRFDNIKTVHVP